MADRCDVPGCEREAWYYGPQAHRCRCLAHADGQTPSLRSDVPVKEPPRHERPCDYPFCPVCYYVAPPVAPPPTDEPVECAAEDLPDPVDLVALRALFRGGDVRRLRIRLAFTEIARAEAVRNRPAVDCMWCYQQGLRQGAAEASADAAHAALDATTARLVEVERILERYGALGCEAALRVIRGEPIVRERP